MSIGVLDPEFSVVASQAAIELDSVILGRPFGRFDSIRKIAEFLKCSFEKKVGQAGQMTFDSSTIAVLGNAFDTVMLGHHATTVEDVVGEAWRMAEHLETTEKSKSGELEQMREFCVALARCVSSYRQSIEDMTPTHPNKRG